MQPITCTADYEEPWETERNSATRTDDGTLDKKETTGDESATDSRFVGDEDPRLFNVESNYVHIFGPEIHKKNKAPNILST